MPYSRLRSIADFGFLKVATRIFAEYSSVTSRDASRGSTISSSSPSWKNRRVVWYITEPRRLSPLILISENVVKPERTQPPQQPPSSVFEQLQFGPQLPSCSLRRTGRRTALSETGSAAFFLFASSSMRVPIVSGPCQGVVPYFYLSSREMLFDTFLERSSRHRTNHLVNELAFLEEEEGRDSHDHELLRDVRILVRVHFHKRHRSCIFLRKFVDHGGDRPTGGAPFRPEVDDHVGMVLDDLIEFRIRHVNRLVRDLARFARPLGRLVRGGCWLVRERNRLVYHTIHLPLVTRTVSYKVQGTTSGRPFWVTHVDESLR